jgi:hypothetical protein
MTKMSQMTKNNTEKNDANKKKIKKKNVQTLFEYNEKL